ncbi:14519_t:CDS:2 [Racocetra persica]|uniref:14519_t:CDS:1 n=1 Tax=Racocetra persica TaxID=160502 RepID=A0ACA9MKC6_9GLOM|nr:14519_t:CDS:2 [Racocetra persica]
MLTAKETAIEFCTKRISFANIRPEVLNEIHKFSFLLQRLIAEEVHAIAKRLEEGKCLPNLASAECLCRFFNRYMLPCHHIFHKQLCGANILTPEARASFQETFKESGMKKGPENATTDLQKKVLIKRHDSLAIWKKC